MRVRAGFTLIELIVVIAMIGMLATIAGMTLSKSIGDANRTDRRALLARRLASARTTALKSGRVVVVQIDDSGAVRAATALPDGSVVVDSAVADLLAWDRVQGTPRTSSSDGLR